MTAKEFEKAMKYLCAMRTDMKIDMKDSYQMTAWYSVFRDISSEDFSGLVDEAIKSKYPPRTPYDLLSDFYDRKKKSLKEDAGKDFVKVKALALGGLYSKEEWVHGFPSVWNSRKYREEFEKEVSKNPIWAEALEAIKADLYGSDWETVRYGEGSKDEKWAMLRWTEAYCRAVDSLTSDEAVRLSDSKNRLAEEKKKLEEIKEGEDRKTE